MIFSFARGGIQSAQGINWIIFLEWGGDGWVGEPRVVHDAHVFLLQFHMLWSQLVGRNSAAVFSAVQCREAFYRLGVQDVAEFDSG
jgi:hypothetical protein